MSQRILITGLNGVIGWHLFKAARGTYDVFGTYLRRNRAFENKRCFRVDLDDALEVKRFIAQLEPSVVIHARSICDLDVCETAPELAYEINVGGTKKLIAALKASGSAEKLIYVSTDHIFSGKRGRYDETDEPEPLHVYGRTKTEAERLVKNSGLPYVIVRPGLVIGESVQGNVGPRDFMLNRLRQGKPATYFLDELRSIIRAEIFAARVFELIKCGSEGVYHIASGEVVDRFTLARRLAGEAGVDQGSLQPALRTDDKWAHIRPRDLSLVSVYNSSLLQPGFCTC